MREAARDYRVDARLSKECAWLRLVDHSLLETSGL